MSAVRVSATIFVLLAAYILLGAVLLPAPPVSVASTDATMLNVLGLAWFFAVWAALVAAAVFLIGWTSEGVVATERACERRRSEHSPAAGIEAEEERVLALAS